MTPKERTPEERKAIVAKGVATRQKNIREREAQRLLDIERRDALKCEIKELELKRGILKCHELSNETALTLTNKVLLSEAEIVNAANPWELATGIYFLIGGDKVVYVGQSVNVYARISQHHDKLFDSFAFIPCEKTLLDSLESLYIHVLRPSLNGNMHGGKQAPLSLNKLIGAFGRSGIPDIVCCYKGKFIGIECKAHGNKPTALQQSNLEEIVNNGGIAIVIDETSVFNLKQIIEETEL